MRDAGIDWVERRARVCPDRAALVCEGRTHSFAALAARAREAGGRLHALGVRGGDRVAVLMRTCPEIVEFLHGLSVLGAVAVPLNGRLSPPELGRQLADCGARMLLYDAAARECAAAIAAAWPGVAVSAECVAADRGAAPAAVTGHARDVPAAAGWDRVHSIVYTSGSGGEPKGVQLTYANHFWSAVGSAFNLGAHADDRWLACLPLCHVGGLAIVLRAAIYGITAVLHDGFDPDRVCRAIDTDRVTIVSVVANMLRRLLDARGDRPFPPWLRCVLLGGGPAPAALLQECRDRKVPAVQTYGLTEAASQVTTLAPRDAARKLGSAGRALVTTEIALAGAAPSPRAGETGEILVRGPTVSPGYVRATGPLLDAEGWLHTGDLGRLDEEGFLYVVGRRDEMIISGGENVFPAEVEAALCTHVAVAEACAFGVPDEHWGSAVAAWVRLRDGHAVDARGLEDHLRGRLARFKTPRYIRFVGDFPRTAAGKVSRREVRALAAGGTGGAAPAGPGAGRTPAVT